MWRPYVRLSFESRQKNLKTDSFGLFHHKTVDRIQDLQCFFVRFPYHTDNKLEDLNWFLVFDRFMGQNIRFKFWYKIQWSY